VLSLDSQEKILLDLAKTDGLKVVDILRESGSAHVTDRKVFSEMIIRIMRGEANGLIVWDESRIARNAADGGMVVNMFDIKKLEEIRKPGKTYRGTPDDKFFLTLLFGMSKKESDDKGVNVIRGLGAKADKGWLPSGAKPGYMNDKYAEKGNKTILNDPDRFPIIRRCWDYLLTGAYTPPKILDLLNNEWGYRSPIRKSIGGKPMARSQIYLMFKDTFYYGMFEYPVKSGQWHKGSHEAMITEDEFNRAQYLLGSKKGLVKPQIREFSYTGMIVCEECASAVTAEERLYVRCTKCRTKFSSMNRDRCPKCATKIENMEDYKILAYTYYHCTKNKKHECSQKSVELIELEKQFVAMVEKIKISERFKDWIITYINEINDKESVSRMAEFSNLDGAVKLINSRLDNLLKLKISPKNADGSMLSDEEFMAQKQSLLKEKQVLTDKRGSTDTRMVNWMDKINKAFNFATTAREKFATATITEKKEMFNLLCSKLFLKDKKLEYYLDIPFNYIEEAKKEEITMDAVIETDDIAKVYGNLEAYWTQNPSVLPRVLRWTQDRFPPFITFRAGSPSLCEISVY